VARFQRDYNGTQPGDPVKALDESPLRLLLGSDAVHLAEQSDGARMEADRKWRDLSVSTDFEAGGGSKVHPWERSGGSVAEKTTRLVPQGSTPRGSSGSHL